MRDRVDNSLIPRRASRPQCEIHTDEVPMMNFRHHADDMSRLVRPSRPQDVLADAHEPPRTHSSVVRYRPQPIMKHRQGMHWLFYAGVGLMGVAITIMVTIIVPPLFQRWNDDRVYGFPRTYQIDENVGHGTSKTPMSHFIFLNNKGAIEVTEISGDPDKLNPHLYVVTRITGDMAAYYPVTASFVDANGDGKVDIEITVNNTLFILYNDGTEFKQISSVNMGWTGLSSASIPFLFKRFER